MNTEEFNTQKVLKNVSFNLIGYIYPMVLALIVAPLTVNSLGVRNYGLYVLISTILSLVGLLDLGISSGVNRFITRYYAAKDKNSLQYLISSANFIFLLIGVIGFLLFFLISFLNKFTIYEQLIKYPDYSSAIFFAGILFFISASTTLFSIIPNALNRFDISNKVGLITITLQQLSIVFAVLHKATISQLFIITSIVTFFSFLLNLHVSQKLLPDIRLIKFGFNKKEVLNFYKFGIASFTNSLASSSLSYLDRIIIPFLMGPSNLTYYSLSGNIASKTTGLANILSSTLFPLTTYFDSKNNINKIKIIYIRSTRLLLITSSAIVITMISFSYKILNYWINTDVAEKSYQILILLAVTNLILSCISPISNILLGIGKLKLLTLNSLIMAVLNITLIFILTPKFGLLGIAWAYLLSVLPIFILIYRVETKYLKLDNRIYFYINTLSKIAFISTLVLFINSYILTKLVNNLLSLLIILPVSICLFLILYNLFGFFEKEDINDIKLFLKLKK
jgi:O-antigen/teichoic acid export membrane protein